MIKEIVSFQSVVKDQHVLNFERFLGLLLKWNRAFNLTTVIDPIEVYEKHFADSVVPIRYIYEHERIVDIGTGAGFPGIPIKILRESVDVTLVEATAKKVSFCEHVIRELALQGIKIVQGRAEAKDLQKNLGRFDVVISRATLKLPEYVRVGSQYVKNGGRLIAMLGAGWVDDLDDAISDVKKAGLKLTTTYEYILPVSESKRALLIFEKKPV